MADTTSIELIPYSSIKLTWPYFTANPFIHTLYQKGKNPCLLHVDYSIDTSTLNTFTETTAPTNLATGQVYLRSDNAADTTQTVTLLGQKTDGSFGNYTFSLNGTTAVDCGTWNFIMFPSVSAATLGNVIIDNDGASTTVYWTLALGASDGKGAVYIPDGYYGAILNGKVWYDDEPGTAGYSFSVKLGGDVGGTISRNHMADTMTLLGVPATGQVRIPFSHKYRNGMNQVYVHQLFITWEA